MLRRAILQGLAFAGLAAVIQLVRGALLDTQPLWDGGLVAILAGVGVVGGVFDVRRQRTRERESRSVESGT